MHTRADAEQYVTACLTDFAAEHDVQAIADAIYAENGGTWNFAPFDTDRFWVIIEEHAL